MIAASRPITDLTPTRLVVLPDIAHRVSAPSVNPSIGKAGAAGNPSPIPPTNDEAENRQPARPGRGIMVVSLPIVLEVQAMERGRVGDVIVVESEKVGQPTRSGEILEVRGEGDLVHYLVRWDNGHESTYFPSGATVTFKHRQPAG